MFWKHALSIYKDPSFSLLSGHDLISGQAHSDPIVLLVGQGLKWPIWILDRAAALGRPGLFAASVFLNGKPLPICLPAKGGQRRSERAQANLCVMSWDRKIYLVFYMGFNQEFVTCLIFLYSLHQTLTVGHLKHPPCYWSCENRRYPAHWTISKRCRSSPCISSRKGKKVKPNH